MSTASENTPEHVAYLLLERVLPSELAGLIGMAVIALIRIASIRWKITLPVLRIPPGP